MSTDQIRRDWTTPLYARIGGQETQVGTVHGTLTKNDDGVFQVHITSTELDASPTEAMEIVALPDNRLPQLQVLYLPEHSVGEVNRYPFALVASGVGAEHAAYMRDLLQPFAEQVGAVAVLVSLEPLEVI